MSWVFFLATNPEGLVVGAGEASIAPGEYEIGDAGCESAIRAADFARGCRSNRAASKWGQIHRRGAGDGVGIAMGRLDRLLVARSADRVLEVRDRG